MIRTASPDAAMSPERAEPRPRVACEHCGLDVPVQRAQRGDPFCCEGCRHVHALIHEKGLERYYELRQRETSPPPEDRQGTYAWLDPLLASVRSGDRGGVRRLTLDVQGIHCAACVWLLRELFLRRRGAVDLRLNPSMGKAEFTWLDECYGDADPAGTGLDLEDYLREAARFGYRFGPDRRTDRRGGMQSILRIGVCAAAAMNVMIFSFCFYAGLGPEQGRIYTLFGQLNLALATFAVAVGGSVFFRSAAAALRRGIVHLDLPIALGIALSWAGSTYVHFTRGPEAAYFDTVATFVTLMLVGRWLQERVLQANRNRILQDEGIDQIHVRRRRGGEIETIPAHEIGQGDELWIAPGELIPVASVAVQREGTITLDWITGESDPRSVEPGDDVPAGAFNAGRSPLAVSAAEVFADSRLHELIGDLSSGEDRGAASAGAARSSRFWHRLGTIYVLSVLALATSAFLAWVGRDSGKAVDVAVAVLVVTCPCALGLATPLARELAHVALRRRGVFVRREGFLDRVLAVRAIVFDKTGTLTLGRLVPTVTSAQALDALTAEEREVLLLLTVGSNHPVSRALARALGGLGVTLPPGLLAVPTREVEGSGIEATVGGRSYRLGRGPFATPACDEGVIGGTVFSREGRLITTFTFEEGIRPDAAEEVRRLRADGLAVHLLSGDSAERSRAVASAVGIAAEDCEGNLDPWSKAARVHALGDRTWMVGDGLNDAPSFDAALCTATPAIDRPALPAKADVYYLGEGISAVRRCLLAARRLRAVIRANLVFAFSYNAVALVLCFTGLINPLVAAVLMPISSVTVVGHTALRMSGRRLAWMS